MTLDNIFIIVFILSASFLCIFTIVYLKKIFEQVEAVRKDIHMLVENTVPILSNMKEITERVKEIVIGIECYWEEIENSISNLREKISKYGPWEIFSEESIHAPVIIKKLRSIAKGITAFKREYKRK